MADLLTSGVRPSPILLVFLTILSGLPSPVPARIDWQADPVWTEHYDRGMQALKEKKYVRAGGWLEKAVARAEEFGPFDERLIESLEQLQRAYEAANYEEEADAVAVRLAEIIARRPETAIERHTRQKAHIDALYSSAGRALEGKEYRRAERALSEALAIADSIPAFDRNRRADLRLRLAQTLLRLGDPVGAEPLFLSVLVHALTDDPPDGGVCASVTATLSDVYSAWGLQAKANRSTKLSKEIASNSNWYEETFVLKALWDLLTEGGDAALAAGRPADALELHLGARDQAVKIAPDDDRVGRSLGALGVVHHELGMIDAAETLLRQSTAIIENVRGSKDRYLAEPYIHLGELLAAEGHWAAADSAYRRAVSVLKRHKHDEAERLGTVLHDHALVCARLGENRQCVKYLKEALKSDTKHLGKEHPHVARDAYALASCYFRQEKYGKAEPLFEQAVAVAERSLGSDDPMLAAYLTGYADMLDTLARTAEAERLRGRAEAIMERTLGIGE